MAYLYKTLVLKDQNNYYPYNTAGPFPGQIPPPGAVLPPGAPGAPLPAPTQPTIQPQPANGVQAGAPVVAGESAGATTNTMVPFDKNSMFGHAPYANATNTALVAGSNAAVSSEKGDSAEKLSAAVSEQTELLKEVASSLRSVATQLTKLDERSRDAQAQAATGQAGSDLKAELHAIKTLLLANHLHQKGGSGASAGGDIAGLAASVEAAEQQLSLHDQGKEVSSQAQQRSDRATPPDPMDELIKISKAKEKADKEEEAKEPEKSDEEIKNEKMAACRQALAKMRQACSSKESLEAALKTLLLYLSNLIANWDAIPYGRISTNNPTYTKSLKDVEHHIEFLKACGFEEKAGNRPTLEFTEEWRSAREKWSEEVLKDARKNLQSIQEELKNQTTSTPIQTSQSSSQTGANTQTLPIAPAQTMGLPSTITQANPIPSTQETSNANGAVTMNTSAAASTSEAQPSGNATESYPQSFFEVSNMLAKDKNWRPPNMKDIPNSLSTEASKFQNATASTALPKPWEANKEGGATSAASAAASGAPGAGQAVSGAATFDDFLQGALNQASSATATNTTPVTQSAQPSSPIIEEVRDGEES